MRHKTRTSAKEIGSERKQMIRNASRSEDNCYETSKRQNVFRSISIFPRENSLVTSRVRLHQPKRRFPRVRLFSFYKPIAVADRSPTGIRSPTADFLPRGLAPARRRPFVTRRARYGQRRPECATARKSRSVSPESLARSVASTV